MKNRNIYKMDDVLIIGSFLMLVPAIYMAWPWLSGFSGIEDIQNFVFLAPEILGSRLEIIYLYLGGSLLSQVVGRSIRKTEKKTLEILDALLYSNTSTISHLANNMGYSISKTRKMAEKLASIKSLNIHLENDTLTVGAPKSTFSSSSPWERPKENSFEIKGVKSDEDEISGEIPQDLKDFLHSDSMDFSEKLETFSHMTSKVEVLQGETGNKESVPFPIKKLPIPLPILLFLFLTPLWPIPILVIGIAAYKEHKKTTNQNGEEQK